MVLGYILKIHQFAYHFRVLVTKRLPILSRNIVKNTMWTLQFATANHTRKLQVPNYVLTVPLVYYSFVRWQHSKSTIFPAFSLKCLFVNQIIVVEHDAKSTKLILTTETGVIQNHLY